MAKTRALIVFAHGAGAPSSSAWMLAWRARLAALGDVVTFDYPYMAAGRKAPDRLPVLIECHRAVLADARARFPRNRPVVLAGKSMGSRVGAYVSLDEKVDGLVCLGFPLGRTPDAKRDELLRSLATPVLFVQGSRDTLCPLERLQAVRREMRARNELHVVAEGDHSLIVGKRILAASARTQEDVDATAFAAIRAFVASL